MSILLPTAMGGAIAASDSTSVSTELDASGLPVGTVVWNADVGAFFKKTVSTASLVTDEILAVLNEVGTRWIVETSGHASTADAPANATTFTADLNVATTSLKGLQSAADKSAQDMNWRFKQGAVIRALTGLSTLTRCAVSSDCNNLNDLGLQSATGTGATTVATSIKGGGVIISSGGTAGGLQIVNLGSTTGQQVDNVRTGKWAVYTRTKILNVATGSGQNMLCAMGNGTNYAYIAFISVLGVAQLVYAIDNGSAGTSTGVLPGAVFRDLLITCDGTTVTFYVDGVSVGTLAASGFSGGGTSGAALSYSYNAAVNAVTNFVHQRWAVFTEEG